MPQVRWFHFLDPKRIATSKQFLLPASRLDPLEGIKRNPARAASGCYPGRRDTLMPGGPSGGRRSRKTGFQAHLGRAPTRPHHEVNRSDDSKRRGKYGRSTNDPGQEFHESRQDSMVGLDLSTQPLLEPVKNT